MSRTKQELLASFKKANKEARERKALIAGFKNASEYLKYLTEPTTVNKTVTKTSKTTSKKEANINMPTIHIVDVLDGSGSMSGEKLKQALLGINSSLKELNKDNSVNYTYTLCDFDDKIKFPHSVASLKDLPKNIHTVARGTTALYDAIGMSAEKLKKVQKKDEKVLVNIYTDGGENASTKFSKDKVRQLIIELEKQGFTFTFIGTKFDTNNVISNLNIKQSNTLVYDGTAQGLSKSMATNSVARTTYVSKVKKGEDVSFGFFKDIE